MRRCPSFSSPHFSSRGMYCWLAHLGVPRLWGNLLMVVVRSLGLVPPCFHCVKRDSELYESCGRANWKSRQASFFRGLRRGREAGEMVEWSLQASSVNQQKEEKTVHWAELLGDRRDQPPVEEFQHVKPMNTFKQKWPRITFCWTELDHI